MGNGTDAAFRERKTDMCIDREKLTEILRETRKLVLNEKEASQVTEKGRADYVTQVDFHVQEFVRGRLEEAWPDIQFMGEEKDNSSLDFGGSVWILDPVDGTTNLIHGFMHSAVSLGLCERGEVVCGAIYQPYTDEMFYATKGEGAWLNGKRIHVSDAPSMEDSLIAIGTTPYEREYADQNFALFKKIFLDCQDIRRIGSAAIELAYVACGRLDAFFEQNLKPWDFAAGTILIEEAGGTVTDFEGKRPVPWKNGSIIGSNGKIGAILVEKYMGGIH